MTDNTPQKFVHRKDDHRPPTYSPKASGDSSDPEKKARSKSKNRIPKRLRYELENALVGLCDIWFEEIKPYLVRNKIKLHVHDDKGGGSGDRGEVSSTFKCSHLDPGRSDRHRYTNANFVSCCSTQPTVLKAPCRKQPPTQLSQKDAQTQNHYINCKKERARKPRKRRKCQQTQSRQPVPRLCRTYSIPPLRSPTETIVNTLQQISHLNYKDLKLNRKPQMKNASTLTDYFSGNIKIKKKIFNAKSTPPKLFRRDATAALSPSKQNVHLKDIPLFQDDLIDIITKIHKKEMEELLISPGKDEFPSIMNSYVPSKIKSNTKEFSKFRPWR